MSVSSVRYPTLLRDLEKGFIEVSIEKGARRFKLDNGNGPSLTMKKIIHELNQLDKTNLAPAAFSSLVGQGIVLELKGKAKLANAPSKTWFKVKVHQIFGNRSFNKNVHLEKLNAFPSPATLTPEQKSDLDKWIKFFDDKKSNSKDEYKKIKKYSEIKFALELAKMNFSLAKGQKYSQIQSDRLEKFEKKYPNMKNHDMVFNEICTGLSKLTPDQLNEFIKEVGKKHPWLAMKMLFVTKPSYDNLGTLAQIKELQPFLLKTFKENEFYY